MSVLKLGTEGVINGYPDRDCQARFSLLPNLQAEADAQRCGDDGRAHQRTVALDAASSSGSTSRDTR